MSWFWNRSPNTSNPTGDSGGGGAPGDSAGGGYPPAENPGSNNRQDGGGGGGGRGRGRGRGRGKPPGSLPEEGRKWVEFDPTGLERAAKAVKELDTSAHAVKALDLAKMQETTSQLKHQEEIKKREEMIRQIEVEKVRIEQEERRKTIASETKGHQERAQYQDQLARRRYDDQTAQQRKLQEDNLRQQEESVQKQEAMRRKTIEYEAELKHRNEMMRVEAEVKGKARTERENQDLTLERIRLNASEQRTTVLESVKAIGTLIGHGLTDFITDWDKVSATAAGLTLVAFGIYTARMGTGIAGRFVEARLGKPSLIRETSRLSFFQSVRHPIQAIRRLFARPSDPMAGIIFEPQFEEKMRSLAKSTTNTKKNGGLYQNVLMYGPPGTGKTLFAKSLAVHSGMDYAVMTGGDIVPLGKEGVTAMHKVFDWANASKKGVVVFVDEADAFLRKRSEVAISEDLRSTLNAFLYRTGESSRKFMLVLASNLPDQFDWAINDRLDAITEFHLPGEAERIRMLKLYFSLFLLSPPRVSWWKQPKSVPLESDINWEGKMKNIAEIITGFSGREISKLAISWQAAAFGSQDGVLTVAMMDQAVDEAIKQHEQKRSWITMPSPR